MMEVAQQQLGLPVGDEPKQEKVPQLDNAQEAIPELVTQGETLTDKLKPDEPEQMESVTEILEEDGVYNRIFFNKQYFCKHVWSIFVSMDLR